MSWTKEDEAILKVMLERKARDHDIKRDCVQRLVHRTDLASIPEDMLVDKLIEEATTFRKVLEPFDV